MIHSCKPGSSTPAAIRASVLDSLFRKLAALSLELQERIVSVRSMPAGPVEMMAEWSLSARISEAVRRLEGLAADPSMKDGLLEIIESTSSSDRAVFSKLVASLLNGQTFKAVQLDGSGDSGVRLQRLSNELKVLSQSRPGPRSPLTSSQIAAEIRPGLDLRRTPPRLGTITGGMNYQPLKLTFDRINWTIEGGINLQPVRIKIDHAAKTISGGANQAPVEIKFEWSPERIVLDGGVNHSPLHMDIDWQSGLLTGYANHSPLRIDFNMETGILKGYVNHNPISLTFDKFTGKITGGINLMPVDMAFENLDLFDFITHFYLFVK